MMKKFKDIKVGDKIYIFQIGYPAFDVYVVDGTGKSKQGAKNFLTGENLINLSLYKEDEPNIKLSYNFNPNASAYISNLIPGDDTYVEFIATELIELEMKVKSYYELELAHTASKIYSLERDFNKINEKIKDANLIFKTYKNNLKDGK